MQSECIGPKHSPLPSSLACFSFSDTSSSFGACEHCAARPTTLGQSCPKSCQSGSRGDLLRPLSPKWPYLSHCLSKFCLKAIQGWDCLEPLRTGLYWFLQAKELGLPRNLGASLVGLELKPATTWRVLRDFRGLRWLHLLNVSFYHSKLFVSQGKLHLARLLMWRCLRSLERDSDRTSICWLQLACVGNQSGYARSKATNLMIRLRLHVRAPWGSRELLMSRIFWLGLSIYLLLLSAFREKGIWCHLSVCHCLIVLFWGNDLVFLFCLVWKLKATLTGCSDAFGTRYS